MDFARDVPTSKLRTEWYRFTQESALGGESHVRLGYNLNPRVVAVNSELVGSYRQGDAQSDSQLFEAVYLELKRLASRYLRHERGGHTLQTTALVHETWLRVNTEPDGRPLNRQHFIGIAARAMKNILVDHARAHGAGKRGGDFHRVDLDSELLFSLSRSTELIALVEALERLAVLDSQQAELVELKYFGGFTFGEIATTFGYSERTAKREWELARAWLHEQLSGSTRP